MHRIDSASAVTVLPQPKPDGTPGFFQPGVHGGVEATIVEADWLNTVQEELSHLIEESGQTLSKIDNTQLLQALRNFIDPPDNDLLHGRRRRPGAAIGEWVPSGRIRLTASLDLYVNAATGDDGNDGTSGSPFLTIQRAADYLVTNIDAAGLGVTVHVAPGLYNGFFFNGNVQGSTFGNIVFQGDVATPSNCIITNGVGPAAGFGAVTTNGGYFRLRGFRVQSTAASCILAGTGGSFISMGDGMEFGVGNLAHMQADPGGTIGIDAPYTITNGSFAHVYAAGGLIAYRPGATPTIPAGTAPGSIVFPHGNAWAENGGVVQIGAVNWIGTTIGVAGRRWYARGGGIIDNGERPGNEVWPGTTNGNADWGGISIDGTPRLVTELSVFDAAADNVTPISGSPLSTGRLPPASAMLAGYTLQVETGGTPPAGSNAPQIPLEAGDLIKCVQLSANDYAWVLVEPNSSVPRWVPTLDA